MYRGLRHEVTVTESREDLLSRYGDRLAQGRVSDQHELDAPAVSSARTATRDIQDLADNLGSDRLTGE